MSIILQFEKEAEKDSGQFLGSSSSLVQLTLHFLSWLGSAAIFHILVDSNHL